MMGDDRRPDYLDRDKKSFSELDRMRREGGGDRDAPRGRAAQERAKRETDRALGLQRAALDVLHHEPDEAVGLPATTRDISCFLDADATDVLLVGLDAAVRSHAAGTLEVTRGLRSQLRLLAEHTADDVADAAEALLDAL